jgi:hypothetical protein
MKFLRAYQLPSSTYMMASNPSSISAEWRLLFPKTEKSKLLVVSWLHRILLLFCISLVRLLLVESCKMRSGQVTISQVGSNILPWRHVYHSCDIDTLGKIVRMERQRLKASSGLCLGLQLGAGFRHALHSAMSRCGLCFQTGGSLINAKAFSSHPFVDRIT